MNNDVNNQNVGTPDMNNIPSTPAVDNNSPMGAPMSDASAPNPDFSNPAPVNPPAPEQPVPGPAFTPNDPAPMGGPAPMGPVGGPNPGGPAPMPGGPAPIPGAPGQPAEGKKDKKFIIIIAVIAVAVIAVLVILGIKLLGGNGSGGDNPEPNPVTPSGNGENNGNGGNGGGSVGSGTKEEVYGYEIEIPNGYVVYEKDDKLISIVNKSKQVMMGFQFFNGLDYSEGVAGSSSLINSIKTNYGSDITLTTNGEKTIGSKNWYVIEGQFQGLNYLAAFTEFTYGVIYVEIVYVNGDVESAIGEATPVVESVTKKSSNFGPEDNPDVFAPNRFNLQTTFDDKN